MRFFLKTISYTFLIIGILLLVAPAGYVFAVNTPEIWYAINQAAFDQELAALGEDPISEEVKTNYISNDDFIPTQIVDALPPVNESIAPGRRVIVPSIGIYTDIQQGTNQAEALTKGVWLMPKHSTPTDNVQPVVLAAHRWGHISLPREFRTQHLFYNLHKLGLDEEIIIQWDQREFKYKVRYKEQGEYVSRLSDLILITCQTLNSTQRIFVYAERVN